MTSTFSTDSYTDTDGRLILPVSHAQEYKYEIGGMAGGALYGRCQQECFL